MAFKQPPLRYIGLTEEMWDALVDRLNMFSEDPDAATIGNEITRQQLHNPNHTDDNILSTVFSNSLKDFKLNSAIPLPDLNRDKR